MKSKLTWIAASTLLAALAVAQPRYNVTDLGALGGPGTNSNGLGINLFGWTAGSSNLVPDAVMTGTLVSDEHHIHFTTAPTYKRDPKPSPGMFSGPDLTMISALHGFTEAGNSTLCQLVEGRSPNSMNFSLRQSITSRAFRVLALVVGQNLLSPRHLEFADTLGINGTLVVRSVFAKVRWRF